MKDYEEIFGEIRDLVAVTNSIHAENFSNENILRNENFEISQRDEKIYKDTEVSWGVQSKNNCSVMDTPLAQSSAPSSPGYFEGSSPVAYFKSLTPALEDDMWSIESLEDMAHSNDELEFFPYRVVFKEKKRFGWIE
jgi:hypothetical protein